MITFSCVISVLFPLFLPALPLKSEEEVNSNGVTSATNKKVSLSSKVEEDKDPPLNTSKTKSSKGVDINEDDEIDYIEKIFPRKSSNVNQFDENLDNFTNEQQTGKGFKLGNNVVAAIAQATSSSVNVPPIKSNSKQLNSTKENYNSSNSALTNVSSSSSLSSSSKKGKNMYKELQPSPSPVTFTNNKDEVIQR